MNKEKEELKKELVKEERKIEEKNKKDPISDMQEEGGPVTEQRSGKDRRKA